MSDKKNIQDMIVGVDVAATAKTLEYLAILKDRVERGETLPKDISLSVIAGYANNLRALLG